MTVMKLTDDTVAKNVRMIQESSIAVRVIIKQNVSNAVQIPFATTTY